MPAKTKNEAEEFFGAGSGDPFAESEKTGAATEESLLAELTDAQRKFRTDRKNEAKRFVEITDSEFWFCVCFQTREQKDEALKKLGLWEIGDKYLDGLEVAKVLGVKLDGKTPKLREARVNKRWQEFAGIPEK